MAPSEVLSVSLPCVHIALLNQRIGGTQRLGVEPGGGKSEEGALCWPVSAPILDDGANGALFIFLEFASPCGFACLFLLMSTTSALDHNLQR